MPSTRQLRPMVRIHALLLVSVAALLPVQPLTAQETVDSPDESRFWLTPHVGGYSDYVTSLFDFQDLGYSLGARATWWFGPRAGVFSDITYMHVAERFSHAWITDAPSLDQWVATLGMEFLPLVGKTRIALGLGLGVTRHKSNYPGPVHPAAEVWSSDVFVIPSLAIERALRPGLRVRIAIRDYVDSGELAEDNLSQNYGFAVGLSFAL